MVEIIKHGQNPLDKSYDFKCTYCGCEFRAKIKECKSSTDQRDGNSINIDCPECGHSCWRLLDTSYPYDR